MRRHQSPDCITHVPDHERPGTARFRGVLVVGVERDPYGRWSWSDSRSPRCSARCSSHRPPPTATWPCARRCRPRCTTACPACSARCSATRKPAPRPRCTTATWRPRNASPQRCRTTPESADVRGRIAEAHGDRDAAVQLYVRAGDVVRAQALIDALATTQPDRALADQALLVARAPRRRERGRSTRRSMVAPRPAASGSGLPQPGPAHGILAQSRNLVRTRARPRPERRNVPARRRLPIARKRRRRRPQPAGTRTPPTSSRTAPTPTPAWPGPRPPPTTAPRARDALARARALRAATTTAPVARPRRRPARGPGAQTLHDVMAAPA